MNSSPHEHKYVYYFAGKWYASIEGQIKAFPADWYINTREQALVAYDRMQ